MLPDVVGVYLDPVPVCFPVALLSMDLADVFLVDLPVPDVDFNEREVDVVEPDLLPVAELRPAVRF